MLKESIITVAARLMQMALMGLTMLVISRNFGPEGQGVYSLMKNYMAILVLLLDLGVMVSIIYFAGQKKYTATELTWTSAGLALVNGTIGMAIAFFIYLQFPQIFKGVGMPVFWLALLSLPLTILFSFLMALFLGLQKILAYNKLNMAYSAISGGILVASVYLFPDIRAVFAASLLSLSLSIAIIFFCLAGAGLISKPAFRIDIAFDSVKWGFKGQVGNIIQFLNYRLDVFIVNFFLNPAAVGLYFVAVSIAEASMLISQSMATVVLSRVANSRNRETAATMTSSASRLGFSVNIAIVIIISLFSGRVIGFALGEAFTDSVAPLLLLLPGVAFFGITKILASYIAGIGHPEYNSRIAAISLVFTFVLDMLLIPKFGINGAAMASSVSYIISTIITIYYYKKFSNNSVRVKDVVFLRIEDLKNLMILGKAAS